MLFFDIFSIFVLFIWILEIALFFNSDLFYSFFIFIVIISIIWVFYKQYTNSYISIFDKLYVNYITFYVDFFSIYKVMNKFIYDSLSFYFKFVHFNIFWVKNIIFNESREKWPIVYNYRLFGDFRTKVVCYSFCINEIVNKVVNILIFGFHRYYCEYIINLCIAIYKFSFIPVNVYTENICNKVTEFNKYFEERRIVLSSTISSNYSNFYYYFSLDKILLMLYNNYCRYVVNGGKEVYKNSNITIFFTIKFLCNFLNLFNLILFRFNIAKNIFEVDK